MLIKDLFQIAWLFLFLCMWSSFKLYFCNSAFFVVENRYIRHRVLIIRTHGWLNVEKREREEKWGWQAGVWSGSYVKDSTVDQNIESWRGSQLQGIKGWGIIYLKCPGTSVCQAVCLLSHVWTDILSQGKPHSVSNH